MSSRIRRALFTSLMILPVALFSMGNGQKIKSSYLMTCHIESTEDQAPKFATPMKLGKEMRQYYFSKIPDITDKQVAYFYPFVASDGQSYGVAFQLTEKGRAQLKSLTLTNQGKLLGIRVVPNTYAAVYIDIPVEDGILVVWEGLNKQQLAILGKKFPHAEEVVPSAQAPQAVGAAGYPGGAPTYPTR